MKPPKQLAWRNIDFTIPPEKFQEAPTTSLFSAGHCNDAGIGTCSVAMAERTLPITTDPSITGIQQQSLAQPWNAGSGGFR